MASFETKGSTLLWSLTSFLQQCWFISVIGFILLYYWKWDLPTSDISNGLVWFPLGWLSNNCCNRIKPHWIHYNWFGLVSIGFALVVVVCIYSICPQTTASRFAVINLRGFVHKPHASYWWLFCLYTYSTEKKSVFILWSQLVFMICYFLWWAGTCNKACFWEGT